MMRVCGVSLPLQSSGTHCFFFPMKTLGILSFFLDKIQVMAADVVAYLFIYNTSVNNLIEKCS